MTINQIFYACTFEAVVECHANACVGDGVNENQVVFRVVEVVHERIKL